MSAEIFALEIKALLGGVLRIYMLVYVGGHGDDLYSVMRCRYGLIVFQESEACMRMACPSRGCVGLHCLSTRGAMS